MLFPLGAPWGVHWREAWLWAGAGDGGTLEGGEERAAGHSLEAGAGAAAGKMVLKRVFGNQPSQPLPFLSVQCCPCLPPALPPLPPRAPSLGRGRGNGEQDGRRG